MVERKVPDNPETIEDIWAIRLRDYYAEKATAESEPIPEPTQKLTRELTQEPIPEPTQKLTQELTQEPTPEPSPQIAVTSSPDPTSRSAVSPSPESATEPTPELILDLTTVPISIEDRSTVEAQLDQKRTSRRSTFFRIFTVVVALSVLLLFTVPSLFNYYQGSVSRRHDEAARTYYQLYKMYVAQMEDASSRTLMPEGSEEEFDDLITESYIDGINAMRDLYIYRLEHARGKEEIEFEIREFEKHRDNLSQEYIRIFEEWYENSGPRIVTS
ncbi:MAG: hypothetical protein FWE87_02350 [Coriobacteriia bacterium]|nr:hypothetical protein [Coriobacteriia bacterium]